MTAPAVPVPPMGYLRRSLELPEVNVAIFAFLLNFPWEFLQSPLFRGLATAPHWQAVKTCALATIGDAAIALGAFWFVAVVAGSRRWITRPERLQLIGFVGAGLAATVVIERWATGVSGRWAYADAMPVVPLIGVGLAPMIQWLTLPLLVVWFARRQLNWAPT